MLIDYISCPSGDYYILKMDGRIFSEGHSISAGTFLELLADYCEGVTVHFIEVSNEDMEEGNY